MKTFIQRLMALAVLISSAFGMQAQEAPPQGASAPVYALELDQGVPTVLDSTMRTNVRPLKGMLQGPDFMAVEDEDAARDLAPRKIPAGMVANYRFGGNVIFRNDWNDYSVAGIYKIPDVQGEIVQTAVSRKLYGNGGSIAIGDKFYTMARTVNASGTTVYNNTTFDINTWEQKSTATSTVGTMASALAYDPTTNTIYGCFNNDDGTAYVFGTLNVSASKFTRTAKVQLTGMFNTMVCSPEGVLYATDNNGNLYRINKGTGAPTVIGNFGVKSYYTTSACWDEQTGKIMYIAYPQTGGSYLYSIDPQAETLKAELVYQFAHDEQIVGLFNLPQQPKGDVPGMGENFKANFVGSSRSGSFTFNAPESTVDGSSAEGNIAYTLKVGGVVVKTDSVAYGTKDISVDYAATKDASQTALLYFSNAAGEGPYTTITTWIGAEAPLKVTNVKLEYVDGKMQLTWDEVEETANGRFFPEGTFTYTVKRYTNGTAKTVVTKKPGHTFSEKITAPTNITSYYYTVQAYLDAKAATAVSSNVVTLGHASVPYVADFTAKNSLDEFTIVDANNDGVTWSWKTNGTGANYTYGEAEITNTDRSKAKNDWLISPPMALEKDKTYAVEFDWSGSNAQAEEPAETMEVYIGTSNVPSEMTKIASMSCTGGFFTHEYVPFQAAENAEYCIAVRATSPVGAKSMMFDNFKVSAGFGADAPAAATINTVTPATDGTTVTFTAPAKLMNGNDATLTSVVVTCGDRTIATIDNPEPGKQYSVVDTVANVPGKYVYSTVAYNGEVAGYGCTFERNIMSAPFVDLFSNVGLPGDCVILDSNGDGVTFGYSRSTIYNYLMKVFNHPTNATDDWFFSAPYYLEPNHSYTFTCGTATNNMVDVDQTYSLTLNTAPVPDAVKTTLFKDVKVTKANSYASQLTRTKKFTVNEAGIYYLGVHCTSPAGESVFYIDDLGISEDANLQAPDEPVMNITPDNDGSLKALIRVKTTDKTPSGASAGTINRLEVLRGSDIIFSVDNPVFGREYIYLDSVAKKGAYEYSAVEYNEYGPGQVLHMTKYLGPSTPDVATNINITETTEPGNIMLTWTPPYTDTYGTPLDQTKLSYNVMTYVDNKIKGITPVAEPYFLNRVWSPGDPQIWLNYQVVTNLAGGGSSAWQNSDYVNIGPGFPMPWIESFANRAYAFNCLTQKAEGMTVGLKLDSTSETGIKSADMDNGFYVAQATFAGDWFQLTEPRVHIEGPNPVFSISTYKFATDNENIFDVYINSGAGYQKLCTVDMKAADDSELNKWKEEIVDLSAYDGQDVQFRIYGEVKHYAMIIFDRMRVYNRVDDNVAVTSLDAPTLVDPGKEFKLTASVENRGELPTGAYTLTLMRDGDALETVDGPTIAKNATAQVTFNHTINVPDGPRHTFSVVADYEPDAVPADNTSADVVVMADIRNFAPATDLAGAVEDNDNARLTWAAPTTGLAVGTLATENFDLLPSWSKTRMGEWTTIDVDELNLQALTQGLPTGIDQQKVAWVVADDRFEKFNATWQARSGHKYAVAFCGKGENDDWLITPTLSGEAQTASFWVRRYATTYPETFQVYYSATTPTIDAMTRIDNINAIGVDWEEHTYNLPAGTKYMALRHISVGGLALMVDDFTFTPALYSEGHGNLLGYNIYRDGVKINTEPVTELTFLDNNKPYGTNTYQVSAVYANGESAVSAPVEVLTEMSGIGVIAADGPAWTVSATDGYIIVDATASQPVSIYTADGATIYANSGEGINRHRVAVANAGIYVVVVGNQARKVVAGI